jgi:hypothetical protein
MTTKSMIKQNALNKVKSYTTQILQQYPEQTLPWSVCKLKENTPKVKTEDLGKIFEKVICLSYGINYNAPFKYSLEMEEYTELVARLKCLPNYLPGKYQHTGKGGTPYDFTRIDDGPDKFISAKTNKNGQKVAPYGIGQATPSTFCERIGIPFIDNLTLKNDIQDRQILTETILPRLETNTFDATIIYYYKPDDTIKIIRQINKIPWDTQEYNWTQSANNWNNSTTLKISKVSLLEVQFHEKSRKNMAIRWCFKNVLECFPQCFNIISL